MLFFDIPTFYFSMENGQDFPVRRPTFPLLNGGKRLAYFVKRGPDFEGRVWGQYLLDL